MGYARKLVLHCPNGYESRLDAMVEEFIKDGVTWISVAGKDHSKVEDIIDELVVGDGSRDYSLMTTSHDSLSEAIKFAKSLTGDFAGEVQVVEL